MITALIIDDEVDSCETLALTIQKYCTEVTILGKYENPEEGIEAIKNLRPDLLFLDVQMPQMSGFDILCQLSPVTCQVIFISAYNQYAIKAIRFSALDYLLKPIDVDDLIQAVRRAKERMHNIKSEHQYQSVLNNIQFTTGKIERIAVPYSEGINFYDTDDIIYCKAEGSYTSIFLKNKQHEMVSRNLKDFESLLMGSGFCRVHHSFLINMKHVKKYVRGEGGYVNLTDDYHIDISRRKKEEFLRMLNKV